MAALTPEARYHYHRARVAALSRHHPDDPELVEAERLLLKAAAIERYIHQQLVTEPRLTDGQRAWLAAMLLNGSEA
jgi:hypothetical protein